MEQKQEVIDEEELVQELEPSETFAHLIGRVGAEVGIGNLSLPLFSDLVREHAAVEEEPTETVSGSTARPHS
jgi:hypothetical protein